MTMSTTVPRLFALVIGIDEYKELRPKLFGAVADANAIIEYLSSKTSADRILPLKGKRATRNAIIDKFKTLITSDKIEKNDPIVIYFAGHGGEARIEGEEVMTQMIMPYDASRRTQNKDELPVIPGIQDFEIRKLLNDIAVEKGNNITVIIDCCYSGHGTRYESESLGTERRAEVPLTFPGEFDGRGSCLSEQYTGKDLWSHVLLSACKPDGIARESRHNGFIRGNFTVALLELINEARPTITYNELHKRLPRIPGQHPQCEGYNQNRCLFTLEERPSQFKVCYRNQVILMEGGAAHGVTGGNEEFLVSDDHSTFSLTIEKVYPFCSEMKSTNGMPWPFEDRIVTAFQKVSGEKARLQLYIFPDANGRNVILSKLREIRHLFSCMNTKEEASLALQLTAQGRVHFTIMDPRVTNHGPSRLGKDIPLDNLESVIRAAQHYYWHLLRENPNYSFSRLNSRVTLDFYNLKQTDTFVQSIGDPIETATGDSEDVIVKVVADNTIWYGIELKSKIDAPLYPYIFFFDNADLSIQPCFLPPFGVNQQVDPPLKPNGSLTIGYSSNGFDKVHPGGSGPFVYECSPGQGVDVGFLKLFLSDRYIDLSTLLQGVTTALESDEPSDEGNIRAQRKVEKTNLKPTDGIWVSTVVTVVQERKK